MYINQVWPEWNEDCVLGEGSFGKVYRAKRVEYGRVFYSAIKVLTVPKSQQEIRYARSQGMSDEDIYQYFSGLVDNLLNEITLMDNLKGAKNIVGIEDYKIVEHEGEIGWDIFIRMELLSPFDSFVNNPEFSQKDVIRLGVDICSALEMCEQNQIVHRDIKPDNIFVSRFGEYKLGDFGIARKLETTQANLSRKGTLNYMAPEVYKSEEYGSNVDLYSLGLVLYTLLNNNRVAFLPPYPQPITYKDNEEALTKRLSGVPLMPPCNARASLSAVILKACAYYPQDRYHSAGEFKNALIAEWNMLVQSGDNREIASDAMRFTINMDQKLQNTTNDMSSHGQVVAGAYSTGTTVLNENGGYDYGVDPNYRYGDGAQVVLPTIYSTAKYNKACKILAWPLALALCVLAIVLMLVGDASNAERIVSASLLGIGATVMLAGKNKYAMGVSVAALSIAHIITGVEGVVGAVDTNVAAIVSLVSGALLFLGGLLILIPKEVRLGGSLCVYALAAEWLFHIYQLTADAFSVSLWSVFCSIAAFTVFVWAYGYKSDEEVGPVKLVLHIITLAFAAVVLLQVGILASDTLSVLL